MITVISHQPEALLDALLTAIKSEDCLWLPYAGLLTLADPGMVTRAYFRADLYEKGVVFQLIAPRDEHVGIGIYAAYHARMIGTLLAQFGHLLDSATSTPMGKARLATQS